jgi:cytidylate kinase
MSDEDETNKAAAGAGVMQKVIDNNSIAISGKSGCGNTTVSREAAERLGLRLVNFTFRNLAAERGLELSEVLALAAKDTAWDKEVDSRQVALARESGGCVLGSRLAIWFLPEARLKVYLKAGLDTRVRRIMQREGGSFEEQADFTSKRDKADHERYQRIYGIDNDSYDFADLVIDTDDKTPTEIVDLIVAAYKEKGE